MPEPIQCPNCGASVTYSGDQAIVNCPYCNSPVKVPVGTSMTRWWQALNPTARIVIVLVIVSVVLPTCLGLAASLLGVCVPLLAGMAGLLIPILIGGH
jgi:hypothetical protein